MYDQVSEIHRLLKLVDQAPFIHDVSSDLPVQDLPIAEESIKGIHSAHKYTDTDMAVQEQTNVEAKAKKPSNLELPQNFVPGRNLVGPAEPISDFTLTARVKKSVKALIVYPLIFVLAFTFFYLIMNFSSLTAQVQGFFTKPQDEQILGVQTNDFYTWISGYYFAVADSKMLDPNNDIDKDGLTNYDEFALKTNPLVFDSDEDGYSDGIEVINGYNPWGDDRLTEEQKKIVEKFDLTMINNRISYGALEQEQVKSGQVLGANKLNYDLNKPGVISIPKLKIQVPIIWSKDPADFDKDLTTGVVHYPGTALPGENGVIYISGHSSDYLWKKNQYGQVFAKINYLAPGDDIFIQLYDADGKTYDYRYQVTGNKIYKPDDRAQFVDGSGSKLNISTCWPIGSSKDRIVVTALQVPL